MAEIDGRRVPLTVGYHKVSVEIRDQIARTTIEESFVNHTSGVLEGQFHFPLPADASISGFGMWIGSELALADIVEKQRAREIYETILREKRDPGLLEWTGGNVFKARVYPIPARSEKRIKIVYTQVLPRKGDSYRYSYALQSDLLRQNPLRQLDLEVTVTSTQPLAKVSCPTHLTRNQLTEHAARVEFSAQKYTPKSDFEVVVQTAGLQGGAQAPDVVFIPHQRGDDGYFLLQLQPPSEGAWQRDMLPDGDPLCLLILADTSASMDGAARKAQGEVLAALLGALSPKDTFNLAACDVDCIWAFEKPEAAQEASIDRARKYLADRRSLGWTNLDRAFESVAKKVAGTLRVPSEKGMHVVYLGDGIVTADTLTPALSQGERGPVDGPAFVNRLGQLLGGKGATLHAVAVSSSYDAAVLRGMAGIGGGSLRQVSGQVNPQQAAKDLLAEITRPALKNIQLEFKGLRTARVYPRVLPNVPAGTQQIVLGRYMPQSREQRGEVVATGTLAGKTVTYRTSLTVPSTQYSVPSSQNSSASNPKSQILNPKSLPLAPSPQPLAPSENLKSEIRNLKSDSSFIPRLWARMHLDELLAQGTSQEVQDEIINLSEEFHIITPYTSLLVLETDADRERFKVKRRFQIRDGERLFADARDVAQYQLVQQQMQRAGLWRQGLREQVLMGLAGLGRERVQLDRLERAKRGKEVDLAGLLDATTNSIAPSSWLDAGGPGSIQDFDTNLSLAISQTQGIGFGDSGGDFGIPIPAPVIFSDGNMPMDEAPGRPIVVPLGAGDYAHKAELFPLSNAPDGTAFNARGWMQRFEGRGNDIDGEFAGDPFAGESIAMVPFGGSAGRYLSPSDSAPDMPSAGQPVFPVGDMVIGRKLRSSERRVKASYLFEVEVSERIADRPLIPLHLPAARPVTPEPAKPASLWPADLQELSRSLRTKIDLTKVEGGLVVDRQHESQAADAGRTVSRSQSLLLASAKSWLRRSEDESGRVQIDWARGTDRGVFSPAYGLALVRPAAPSDFTAVYESSQSWQSQFEWSYQDYTGTVEPDEPGQARLVLKHVIRPTDERRILIDTIRHVVLSVESIRRGRVESSQRASDFVEIAGIWLPRKIEMQSSADGPTETTTFTYEIVPAARLDELQKEQLAPQTQASALTLKVPLPKLDAAKDRIAKGQAALEDRLVLLLSLASDQKWPEAHEELARIEALIRGKSMAAWMRIWLSDHSRRLEELRQLVLAEARALATKPRAGERTLLDRFQALASSHISYEEQLEVLDALKPVYARLTDHVQGPRRWGEIRQAVLQSAGRDAEQIALLRELARDYPDVEYNHRILARRLIDQGEYDAGYEVLKTALTRAGANWTPGERDRLYEAWADHLKAQGRWADQHGLVAHWLGHHPQDADPYERYLACLVYTRREAEADQLVADWLKAGLADEPLPKDIEAKAAAAVETATGDNSYLASGDLDPRFLPAMAELLVAHVADEDVPQFVSELTGDYDTRRTDAYKAAAAKILARLKAEAASLPLAQLQTLVSWCVSYADEATEDDWKAIGAAIRTRWDATVNSRGGQPPAAHPAIESLLANSLLQVLGHIGHDEKVAFLRVRLEKSDEMRRADRASALFEALLESPWSAEVETESLALIDKVGQASSLPGGKLSADDETARLRDQVVALYRWTDRMEEARAAKLVAAIERPDKLTRTELADKQAKIRKEVRSDLSARLGRSLALPGAAQDGLKPWLTIEHLTLEARLERELPKVVESSWELLGPVVDDRAKQPAVNPAAGTAGQASSGTQLDAVLRARTLAMLIRLAIRKDAPAAEAEWLGKYLDAAIAAENPAIDARLAKYVLLVALDQPQPLIEQLTVWSSRSARRGGEQEGGLQPDASARGASGPQDDRPQVWQRALAYLKAELGDLAGAIALTEPLAAADVLDAADYRALAGWYQASKLDEKYHQAQVAAWKQLDEWRLRNVLRSHLSPWENRSGPSPGAIDPQLFLVLEALFAKSSNPSEHVYMVRSFYEKSRDFRLIAALADAVVGQSSGNIYRFLKELDSTLEEIDREATVDELLAQVAKVRERVQSSLPTIGTAGQASSGTQGPTGTAGPVLSEWASSGTQQAVDQRALDLLIMLAERRAAEVKNQPGPHVAAAVAALQSASKSAWSPGEPRLFAELLGNLGRISQQPMADERIRVLNSLHAAALERTAGQASSGTQLAGTAGQASSGTQPAAQSENRLAIAHALGQSLIADNRREQAIDVLEAALAEHRQAHAGKLVSQAVPTLQVYGDQIALDGNFVRAESLYRGELARVANSSVAEEVRLLLFRVYERAIDSRGSTSLGSGLAQYRAATALLAAELAKANGQDERRQLLNRLCDMYAAAHRHQELAPAVKADVVAFGDTALPPLLERQIDNYQEMVERVQRTIRDTAGYLPALRLLLTRIESEPAWLARKGDDGWRHFAWELGILHDELRGKLGGLEPRFLKLVLTALRRELTTHTERRQVIYHDGSTHFWQERTDDFVRVAEEVLAEQRDSRQAIMYISDYLYRGVHRHARAIEILLDAHRRGLLDEEGRVRLAHWLQEQGRYGESIAFLEPLVKEQPERPGYRIQLMHAYFQTKQPEALRRLLAETDKFFHEEERWNEDIAAALATSCLENELLPEAVEYLKEAIERREAALKGQTTGDRTLAQYYIDRAYAYAGLAGNVGQASSLPGMDAVNTKAAVDDACSALVVWGAAGDGLYRRYTKIGADRERVHPLDVLRDVLTAAPDLDGYVVELDAAVAKSGADRPIVRKSLGENYFDRGAFDKALAQLKLAVELAPNDGAIHAKLVECYDALMQGQQAAEQLYASVELARRDIGLWTKLAERLEKLEQPDQAERARTSLVEMLPSETEGHAKLAEIRQAQGRWDEATLHWRHVARIRKLEPAGLLGLAAAQIHDKRRDDADRTLRELETTDWPARFHDELRQKQLPKLREEWRKLK
ncbi:MAG: hypothetical protein L0211_19060 [Planctomycetaceae bacterium]|nr:hypothetical protein [Planctomycetaceae bacterium]